ncbi:tyramine oxidase [Actinoplanes sp. TBRC 11911]|uniref:gamma-glutamyltransferase n=1 Tax=Actinoplanes sp. TBRC 11911 TaxID=2729386 RepID=UPI00145EED98|nr:gamma-glutamyltransferase [Actinoplanes sp. TBRC 11911]NMO51173.1 tyramine oxidase [Actinoplanes sp. TBRC 11911]
MRSPVRVALAAPEATAVEVGRSLVSRGGNALDAALATAAALSVVYPHQCTIGGDLVAMVRTPDGEVRAILSIGAAAAGFDATGLDRMPAAGPLSVTVPGVVAGWAAIAGLGARLGWDAWLAPAIALAREGIEYPAGLARTIRDEAALVTADPGLAEVFGRDRLVQPALAGTLDEIAGDWPSFYRGGLGERLAQGLAKLGSPLTADDLADHHAELAEPLTTSAYGASWFAAPPPSQGATFMAVLGSADLLRDALDARLAREALLGDPRTAPVDMDGLLLRGPALPGRSALPGPPATGDTVAVTAVDSDGMAVTLIQSIFGEFGAGLLDPGTGIVLHNRGSLFHLDPAHPARLKPGSRPPHTLCPAIAVRDDTVLALGSQGGRSQPWILAQVAHDALDAADPHATVARPRWILGETDLILEPGVPDADRLAAEAATLGLGTTTVPAPHDRAGHVQMARLRGTTLDAASDPRADGAVAVG